MKFRRTLRPLLLAAGLAGAVGLPTACRRTDTTANPDYATIDEGIIQQYLANQRITTAQRQPSGLYYVPVLSSPGGTRATAGRRVSVLYTGSFLDGRVFDASSRNGNAPIEFVLGQGQVIRGWDEGIALMREGEKATLLIPSALAYGPSGAGATIPPNTVLRFDVELTKVQ